MATHSAPQSAPPSAPQNSRHNARQIDRAPFFAEIDVLAADTPTPRRLWGADVSESGMFLHTTHPFRVGDRVALRFDVEEHEVHVRAAEVMWVRPFEPISVDGRVPGIGLRFLAVDPPARAALRRMVRYALGEHRAGDTTLPDAACQAIQEERAPSSSLPPATRSMLMRAGAADIERTEEMLAVSIPPFTDPPRADQRQASIDAVMAPPMFVAPNMRFSLPPDEPMLDAEARIFDSPAAVTLGPKRSSKPPSSPPAPSIGDSVAGDGVACDTFAGWTFRKAPTAAPEEREQSPSQRLGLEFDDERPGSLLGSTADADSGPTELHAPAVLARDHEPEPRIAFAQPNSMGSLSAQPMVTERRTQRGRAPLRVMPLAAALLCSGALVGVGVGVVSKRIERQPALSAATSPDAAEPMAAAAASPSASPTAAIPAPPPTPAVVHPVADVERALAPVDVIAGVASRPMPTAPPKLAAPAPTRPSAARPMPSGAKPTSKVEVAVGDARVLKTFTLAGPPRIVVDLADATLPAKAHTPNPPGVTRVRFGAPAPGTSRVVVEVEQQAQQATARVVDGRLIISFAS